MRPTLLPVVFLCCLPLSAAEPPINELLRDALYSEEVTRDAEAAAKQYAEVVSRYEDDREFAATAMFRLAEIRRKQGNKDEAIRLYQQVILRFPASGAKVDLSKEHLAALGGKMPEGAAAATVDEESKELARIQVVWG